MSTTASKATTKAALAKAMIRPAPKAKPVQKNADQLEIHPTRMISAVSYFMDDEVAWADDRQSVKIHIPGETVFTIECNKPTVLDLKTAPKHILSAILANGRLTKKDREIIKNRLGDQSNLLEQEVSSPHSFFRVIKAFEGQDKINFEVELNGRWYPVPITANVYSSFFGTTCYLSAKGNIADEAQSWDWAVRDSTFVVDNKLKKLKISEVLKELGIRFTTKENISKFNTKLALAQKLSKQHGKVMDITSSILVKNKFLWFSSLQPTLLGSVKKPKTLIIEDELEANSERRPSYYDEEQIWELPFIRTFSPDMKKYVYADVEDLVEHVFDTTGRERLVLPTEMRKVLDAVFETHADDVFGDMFRGRHGGMVILANGPSGVGKTLTAEVYSEHTSRPLYVLEMGELGTSLSSVEENLQRIFTRAARWNAILLFDEADIFLSKRGEDLDRSAIVGVFLRLLDMYDGTFFLTTNRAEVMDPAFKSRITLKLDYPDLQASSRTKIWTSLLVAAGYQFDSKVLTDKITSEPLNGRQIRNLVRLLKVLNTGKKVTSDQIFETFKFAAR